MTTSSSQASWSKEDLLFVPLGGSGEIGMNANLFHCNDEWLMVDLGISFPDDSMPGVDVVLPALSFIEKRRDKLKGLVITHGHEDHIGAIPYLWEQLKCPIYATPFTMALVRAKLRENLPDAKVKLIGLPFNEDVAIGSFSVEMISLTHSIPDPAGLAIRAGGKTIFHTGDWKFDSDPLLGPVSDTAALKALGDKGVDVMIGDSTNAMVDGRTGSEADAREGLIKEIEKCTGRVAVTCFASNVARVNTLVHAAVATGRSPMLVGRALHRITEAARSCGYLKDWPDLVKEDEFNLIPRENIMLICTGSQGEPRSAMSRIASNSHHVISLDKGDTVMYSSRQIPGNEPAIARVQDNLIRRGITVITDDDAPIHVSGHPGRDEMAEMYQLIRPKLAIPTHGTGRHLKAHAALAQACQVPATLIPNNGDVINISSAEGEVIGSAPVGLQTMEAGEVISIDSSTMRDRRRLLWNGTVSASIVLSLSGELCVAPVISQNGLTEGHRADDYLAEASLRVEDAVMAMSDKAVADDHRVTEVVSQALRGLAKSMFQRRPMAQVHVVRVDALAISGE
ncbi:MAG: ribonuclease J [Alphaproteobacteria bacterium]|nr:ribonuclease J [Alphaproteobacteria bacterium]